MGSDCDFLFGSYGGHRQNGQVMILIVDPIRQYPSKQGRVFRVVIEEQWPDEEHGPQWVQPPAEELPWWLAQCILEDAREQLTEGK